MDKEKFEEETEDEEETTDEEETSEDEVEEEETSEDKESSDEEESEVSEKKGVDRFNREMHKAVCADCGKECEVPFKPSGGRPVYCRDCYRKHVPQRRY
jgi:CxxC-x17-CxxC domain-containing protein